MSSPCLFTHLNTTTRPPFSPLHTLRTFLSHGLCTYLSLCLGLSPPESHMTLFVILSHSFPVSAQRYPLKRSCPSSPCWKYLHALVCYHSTFSIVIWYIYMFMYVFIIYLSPWEWKFYKAWSFSFFLPSTHCLYFLLFPTTILPLFFSPLYSLYLEEYLDYTINLSNISWVN